jgi:hypothetical protein
MSARSADGRCVQILTVVEPFTRECLCLLADQSLTGKKVARALEPVVHQRGAPRSITVDNVLYADVNQATRTDLLRAV